MKAKHRWYIVLLTAWLMGTLCGAGIAEGYPESEHPYASSSDITWTYTHSEEVYALKVTFSEETEMESGWDFLYITDGDGVEREFTGAALQSETLYLSGNRFTVRLVSDSSTNRYGFAISEIVGISQAEYEEYISNPRFTINSSGTITAYSGQIDQLVIPDEVDGVKVTAIGNFVFEKNAYLKTATLPEGLTSIGNYAFNKCNSLSSIDLPEGLTSIGNYAFNECNSLSSIDLPDGLTSIGNYAFNECNSLSSIDLPDGLTSIGNYAFNGCNSLSNIDLPEGMKTIGNSAFRNCKNLSELTIPASVKSVGSNLISLRHHGPGTWLRGGVSVVRFMGLDTEIPSDMLGDYQTDFGNDLQSVMIIVPAGSANYERCVGYGYSTAVENGNITLNESYSRSAGAPTCRNVNDKNIDLNNAQGIAFDDVFLIYDCGYWAGNLYGFEFSDNVMANDGAFAFGDRLKFYPVYTDDAGILRCTGPFYLKFGLAELNTPVVISPVLTEVEEYETVFPKKDIEVEWVGSENATYNLDLYKWRHRSDGIMVGSVVHSVENLTEPRAVIGGNQLLSGGEYSFVITASSTETGESVEYSSAHFKIDIGDAVILEEPVLVAPICSGALSSNEDWMITLPGDKDLNLCWKKVEGAAYYKVSLDAHIADSNSFYPGTEYEVRGTEYTYANSVLRRWIDSDYYNISHFSVNIIAVGSEDQEEKTTVYFRLGDPDVLTMYSGESALSTKAGSPTSVPAGEVELAWNNVEGADSYLFDVIRKDGETYYYYENDVTLDAATCSRTVSLTRSTDFVIILRAMSASEVICCKWFYVHSAGAEILTPVIHKPYYDNLEYSDVYVEWADTGTDNYSVNVLKYVLTSNGLRYYDEEVFLAEGLTDNHCTIPVSVLEVGGNYKIVVVSTEADEITREDSRCFKILGQTESAPEVFGVDFSTNPAEPQANARLSDILVDWGGDTGAELYEVQLNVLNGDGSTGKLLYSDRGTKSSCAVPASAMTMDGCYLLTMRAYDRDMLATVHIACFKFVAPESLQIFHLPADMTVIEEEAFAGNVALEYVIAGRYLEEIGARAFANCSNLMYIDLPESVSVIAADAFDGCDYLTIICEAGSKVEAYAARNGIDYQCAK